MMKEVVRVAPLRFGVVNALVFAVLGLFTGVVALLAGAMMPAGPGGGAMMGLIGGGFVVILMPVLYAVMGFIGGVVGAAVYNLVAGITGGLLVELGEP